jgi:hypothetical protein
LVIRLSCQIESAIGRHELGDYVRELVIGVLGANEEGTQDILVAKLAMSQVLWVDAQLDGQSLLDACDADSQGLYEMFEVLTDGNEEGLSTRILPETPTLERSEFTEEVCLSIGREPPSRRSSCVVWRSTSPPWLAHPSCPPVVLVRQPPGFSPSPALGLV